MGDRVNMKTAAVAILAVAALAVAAYILMGQPGPLPEQDPWEGKDQMYMEDFAESLSSASHVYIMMDLRGAPSGKARTNIMQCGVDLASSTAIGGVPKTFYSMDSECIKSLDDGTTVTVPDSECLAEIGAARDSDGEAIFYIRKANETLIFANELVVGIGEEYSDMECSINAVSTGTPSLPADTGTVQGLANDTEAAPEGGENVPEEAPANSTQ